MSKKNTTLSGSAFLIGRGFTVFRFDNRQVLTMTDAVCEVILRGC